MPSPRYLAAHLLLPKYLRDAGPAAVVSAFERRDQDFFIPVWFQAGFRFSPKFASGELHGFQFGMLSLPAPREATEAYFAAVVMKPSDPTFMRYFLLEQGEEFFTPGRTFVTEREHGSHSNWGAGPPFTGNWEGDGSKFLARVHEIVSAQPKE